MQCMRSNERGTIPYNEEIECDMRGDAIKSVCFANECDKLKRNEWMGWAWATAVILALRHASNGNGVKAGRKRRYEFGMSILEHTWSRLAHRQGLMRCSTKPGLRGQRP